MKAAPFGFHQPSSLAEALGLLEAYEGEARVVAGGQSLVPMMNMRLLRPDALIDINGLEELSAIHREADSLVLGATVRYTTIEHSPIIAERLPLLSRAVCHIGDRQVRNRGTIGGSLVQADPTGEMPLACLTLGASVRVAGPQGSREIPVDELYEGSYVTVLDPRELLTAVVFPPAFGRVAFAEQCRRHNDFAVVSVACVGDRGADGRFERVRIGLGGVHDTVVVAERAGQLVSGTVLTDADIAGAASAALEVIDPPSDIRASAEYRRHLVPLYVRRVLRELRDGRPHPTSERIADAAS